MFAEPLAGWRAAPATERKTVVEALRYAQVERITLVCDDLNMHRLASLYEAFALEEGVMAGAQARVGANTKAWQLAQHGRAETECVDTAFR